MFKWIVGLVHTPTPEKRAERALAELRLELFQAEQRVLDAQMHAAYYRSRIAFCEDVLRGGIDRVSAPRNDEQQQPVVPIEVPRPGLKLRAAP